MQIKPEIKNILLIINIRQKYSLCIYNRYIYFKLFQPIDSRQSSNTPG